MKDPKVKEIIKEVEEQTELVIRFTDEEMDKLGIEINDKFSVEVQDDGSIILKKFGTLEFDLEDFSREQLEQLIIQSCEQDVSVNEIISDILVKIVEENEESE